MKLLTKFGLLTAVVAVSLAGAGCKHNPKNVTPIPRGTPATGSQLPPPIVGQPPVNPNPLRSSPTDGGTARPFNPQNGPGTQELPADPSNILPAKPGEPIQLPAGDLRGDRAIDRTTFAADTVYFEYDRANLKAGENDKVKHVADYLKSNPLHDLAIDGHCDERGTEEYNRALGERRALAVREALVSMGISGSRITTTSFGEDQPADPGHDEAAWSKNRRGEFILLLPKVQ